MWSSMYILERMIIVNALTISLSRAPISDQAPPGSEFEVFNTPCCKDASFSNKPPSPFHQGKHYITVLNLLKSQ